VGLCSQCEGKRPEAAYVCQFRLIGIRRVCVNQATLRVAVWPYATGDRDSLRGGRWAPTMLSALILVCSTAITPDLRDYTRDNVTMTRVPAEFGNPATHPSAAAEDIFYISMCSGGAMIKISAAERPQFILGQLIIFGVAISVVTLVELAIWLAN
jgi:hypothetical protein